jgi:hypothetical protein
MEAEKRIAAIAKDLVDHYVDNILPDGFKAQVVCHSKLAAIRYQKAIRGALQGRMDRERVKAQSDTTLIRRVGFLKAAVVISSDPTNEPAAITEARKEARRWNAVENFCKPFDFDDSDKSLTGIAFLIVCDMLLTGFDAPVEQVMYIDKRLREHNLLQAIARVNRGRQQQAPGLHRRLHRPGQPPDPCPVHLRQGRRAGLSRGPEEHPERDAYPGRTLPTPAAALPWGGRCPDRSLRQRHAAGLRVRGCGRSRGRGRAQGHQASGRFRSLLQEVLAEPEPHSAEPRGGTPTVVPRGGLATFCAW